MVKFLDKDFTCPFFQSEGKRPEWYVINPCQSHVVFEREPYVKIMSFSRWDTGTYCFRRTNGNAFSTFKKKKLENDIPFVLI